MFKVHPKTPMEAEMMCLANALATLLAQKELPIAKFIIINSDCLGMFGKINLKSKDVIGKKVAQILKYVRSATAMTKGSFALYKFRHVKAHNGTNDARSWVNDWCDKEAKKWMRKSL